MAEYRCTRASLYKHKCPGQFDIKARNGHYVIAANRTKALAQMAEDFPGEEFTCHLNKVFGQVYI